MEEVEQGFCQAKCDSDIGCDIEFRGGLRIYYAAHLHKHNRLESGEQGASEVRS